MKKIYKFIVASSSIFALGSISAGCQYQPNIEEIKIKMEGIKYADKEKLDAYTKVFNQVFNMKMKEANLNQKVVSFHDSGNDESATLKEVNLNKFQVAFPGAWRYYQEYLNNKNKNVVAFMQTKTRAFKTKSSLNYNDQSLYDPSKSNNFATLQAQYENELFNSEGGYVNWSDKSMGGFVDYKFLNMYEADKYVDHQRGCIWIYGTNEERNLIKKAWNDKDWETFYKKGIYYGSNDSASKYHLPQALLKKQFNLDKNFTLDSFASSNSKYFKKGKAKELGKDNSSNYHIAFDNENSFAYSNHGNKALENRDFYVKDKNKTYEMLTLTDPIPYNVAIANNSLSKNVLELLAQTYIELANKNNNYVGNLWGLNHYSVISNEQTEFINRIEAVMKQ
ncbi:ABC transporter thiamine pyrophosphate-binding lipoprotein p37/Cypl [Mycoplasmopsis fermentans]|uniref:ABC transporter thiamine pyrophosphate-binding lipoprotein p37/Cypl n=1 Tax=Mycoplasmopsis fermentans TaxID=2115 RepID=UPI0001E330D2|nr:DNA repair protein HhH-GPD [Mycoplasmopsis fermentans]ADN68950.1 high affinity transport system protein p37 precursor [Mycoplasmopsis fermentans JER]